MKKLILLTFLVGVSAVIPAHAARSGRPVVVVTTTSTTDAPVSPN